MIHLGIRSITTGRIIAAAGFTTDSAIWPWVQETIARAGGAAS